MGPANIYLFIPQQASLSIESGYPYGPVYNEGIFLRATPVGGPGSVGNNITITIVAPGTLNSPLSVSVSGFDITVSLETNGAGAPISTADEVIAALTNEPTAAFLVTAARAVGEDGQGVMASFPKTHLAGGSDVGVKTDVGFLGEAVMYQVTTEANPLTGAQTGNVPQDKVVVGGIVKVVIPFKEISLDNLRRGVPSARLVENADGSKRRVDFAVAVGGSLRAQAVKMQISKIKGGFESSLPEDTIIIPEISPAEGEVNFPFAPTTQREIVTNWYAWPNGDTGRWAFIGNENP
jgi:hypothetical protein